MTGLDGRPLPDDVDPALWLPCSHSPTDRDYLYPAAWHTFPGRMGAYCSSKNVYFRISLSEIPADVPEATRYWVRGFLAGNLPEPPSKDLEGADLERWQRRAEQFFATGRWTASNADG